MNHTDSTKILLYGSRSVLNGRPGPNSRRIKEKIYNHLFSGGYGYPCDYGGLGKTNDYAGLTNPMITGG